jgi:ribose/xylose/arabinose/galactoside ABC-type transport system permease subunit
MLWVLILMQIVGAILSKGISVQPSNLINVLTRVAITAAVATGQAMVMISGGIDLTVGSIVILSAIILGGTTSTQSTSILPHIGLVPGILLAVVISLLIGLINGLIISRTKIPPFIVTLAMMLIVTGGTFLATLGVPIYDMSPWFAEFGRMRLLSVPYPIYLWLSLIGIATFILSKTRFGPMVYAIGGSEKAALLSAIDVKKIKVLVYMYSSLMAMIGGFLFIVRTYMIIPSATAGSEYLMDPIAASVIGGISLSGGKGTMKDVLIGILVLGFLLNLLHIMLLPTAYVQTIKGSIIIIAVIVNIYLSKRGI